MYQKMTTKERKPHLRNYYSQDGNITKLIWHLHEICSGERFTFPPVPTVASVLYMCTHSSSRRIKRRPFWSLQTDPFQHWRRRCNSTDQTCNAAGREESPPATLLKYHLQTSETSLLLPVNSNHTTLQCRKISRTAEQKIVVQRLTASPSTSKRRRGLSYPVCVQL